MSWVAAGASVAVAALLVAGASPVHAGSVASPFHGYAVTTQVAGGYTGARATWHDVAVDPHHAVSTATCVASSDVNSALWAVLTDGTVIEVGLTSEACGVRGWLYRYVAITHPDGSQDITMYGEKGFAVAPGVAWRATTVQPQHAYAIVRSANPYVWDVMFDGRRLAHVRTSAMEVARELEVGIESYARVAGVRNTFSHLGQQRDGSWGTWTAGTPHVVGSRMHGLRQTAAWVAAER